MERRPFIRNYLRDFLHHKSENRKSDDPFDDESEDTGTSFYDEISTGDDEMSFYTGTSEQREREQHGVFRFAWWEILILVVEVILVAYIGLVLFGVLPLF